MSLEIERQPILTIDDLSMQFPGVRALSQVSLAFRPGEIHCLLGENGAGKSTLIKILSGAIPFGAYSGHVEMDGRPARFSNAADATARGIATIYQELSLLPRLSVAENIFLGRQPTLGRLPVIDWQGLYREAEHLLTTLGIAIPAATPVAELGVTERQQVEIAKAMSREPRVLILDEPTSALPDAEVERLYQMLRGLRERGTAIIYITHRLEEVFALADTVSVLRDGKLVTTQPIEAFDQQSLVSMMVGRTITEMYPRHHANIGGAVLSVSGLTALPRHGTGRPVLDDVSFEVRQGEIVSLTGLIGSGASEVLMALWGAWPGPVSGHVSIDGRSVRIRNPTDAAAAGLAFVPGDRKEQGLVLSMSASENLTLVILRELSRLQVLDLPAERHLVDTLFERLRIRAAHPGVRVETLSGGNQQKIAIGKWLAASPKVLLLDQPTRGIDVGARVEIYRLMNTLIEQGLAVVMAATDMAEAIGISDRIVVMSRGRVQGEITQAEATQERVLEMITTGGAERVGA